MTISNIPSSQLSGRAVIRTDLTDAQLMSREDVRKDLMRVLPYHSNNRQQIRALQEYQRGYHPYIQDRVKLTRTDVDNKIIVNAARAITRQIVGYFIGKPIQHTHRKGSYRNQMENFNNALAAENKGLVDSQIAEDCSICGLGYRGMFSEANPVNGTHLKILRLDPINTFVVHHSNPLKPPAYAVSSYESGDTGNALAPSTVTTYYTVYTAKRQFIFKDDTLNGQDPSTGGDLKFVSETPIDFGGFLPIVEYRNNMWCLGDWETAVSLMDALDCVTSDGLNDIQQFVNSVLVAMGMELDEEVFANLSKHGFLNVKDIPQGVTPVVEFINQVMDAAVGKEMRDYLEAMLRFVVGVPDRKSREGGGGDTGDAVFMRDGWHDIDLVAASKEQYFIEAERQSLAVMLYILNTNNESVGSLKPQDIQIHFNRNKTANLQSKAQVYQTLTSGEAPLDPKDALDIADLTNNIEDVILRAATYAETMRKERMEEAKYAQSTPNDSKTGGAATAGDGSDN